MTKNPGPTRTAGVPPASAGKTSEGNSAWRSRGYIPHLDLPNGVQHVVFRLADSLPAAMRRELTKTRNDDRVLTANAALDRGFGRRDLAVPVLARLVQTAFLTFHRERYLLRAWCVMPNHVHVLLQIRPEYPIDRIVHSWKSYTAKGANRLLGRTGAFWAPEYFDRFMRDDDHLAWTAAYIEGNPVRAGLCENVSDWPFSSAWQGQSGRDARGPGLCS